VLDQQIALELGDCGDHVQPDTVSAMARVGSASKPVAPISYTWLAVVWSEADTRQ
jgi:hypothetical protein